MSTPAHAGLPQYKSAINLLGKLFAKEEIPSTLQRHRAGYRKFNEDFTAHGKEWMAAIAGTAPKATKKMPAAKKASKAKTRTAGGGTAE
jgi:hypothetical protein